MTKEKMISFMSKKAITDSGEKLPDKFILEWISNISFQPASVGSKNFNINIWLYKTSGVHNKTTFRIKVSSFEFCNKFNNDLNELLYNDDIYGDDYDEPESVGSEKEEPEVEPKENEISDSPFTSESK